MSHHTHTGAEVNMADVAARAQVSIATVSRALRGLPGVSEATRLRVHQAAEELAYVISPEASRLARRDTGRIGVVVRRFDSWFYATMLTHIEERLREAELDVLVYQLDDEERRTRFFRDLPTRRKVDAVILIALPARGDEAERLGMMGVQVIVAGGQLGEYPRVMVDDHAVGAAATQHLLDLGHRRIGMIRPHDAMASVWSADMQRLRGYQHAMDGAGLGGSPELVVREGFDARAGRRGISRLLALPDPPTAVFCYSDELAVGATVELRGRGLSVPGDVALIGVDGHPFGELMGITTLDQHVDRQARLAAEMSLALLRGETPKQVHQEVPWEFVDRGSTGPPRRSAG
jgi:DNA-binding LacI/PurR family transcriptional regulator